MTATRITFAAAALAALAATAFAAPAMAANAMGVDSGTDSKMSMKPGPAPDPSHLTYTLPKRAYKLDQRPAWARSV